jgi:uncharacterized repeat protein (TIGR03803 family)
MLYQEIIRLSRGFAERVNAIYPCALTRSGCSFHLDALGFRRYGLVGEQGMQYRQACRMFGLSVSLISVVAGCGYGGNGGWPSHDGPPSEYSVADGSNPSGMMQGSDGNFYGTTSNGGQFNQGTVFRITPDGAETVLYSFAGGNVDGASPTGDLVQGSDGNFYGATGNGGPGQCPGAEPVGYTGPPASCGTLFKLTPDGAETVLHFFSGGADGGQPTGSLVQGSNGSFYGTTSYGSGTVFAITPQGEEAVLYSFPNYTNDGSKPSSLILGSDGNFYGTTFIGGKSNYGTVFRITPAGVETVLYSFLGGSDGELPSAPLVEGSDGNLYGTTPFGGSKDGTIFRITAAAEETVLYAFPGTANVSNPYSPLIQGSDGNFYGTTDNGGNANNACGADGCGALYKITPAGNETVLHLFAGGPIDGAFPIGNLLQGSDGNFYGTTSEGGQFDGGTVFQITPAGVLTVLHSFADTQNNQ